MGLDSGDFKIHAEALTGNRLGVAERPEIKPLEPDPVNTGVGNGTWTVDLESMHLERCVWTGTA